MEGSIESTGDFSRKASKGFIDFFGLLKIIFFFIEIEMAQSTLINQIKMISDSSAITSQRKEHIASKTLEIEKMERQVEVMEKERSNVVRELENEVTSNSTLLDRKTSMTVDEKKFKESRKEIMKDLRKLKVCFVSFISFS